MKALKNVLFLFFSTAIIISCNSTESCEDYIGAYTDSEVNENSHCAKHLEISKVKGGFLVKQTIEQRMNIKCNHQWDSEAIYECKEGILVNDDGGEKKRLILDEGGDMLRVGSGTQKWLRDNQNKEESTNSSGGIGNAQTTSDEVAKSDQEVSNNNPTPLFSSVKSVSEVSKIFDRLWLKINSGNLVHGKCAEMTYLEDNDWAIIHYSRNDKEKGEEEIQTWLFKSGILCYYETGFIAGARGNLFSTAYYYVNSKMTCKDIDGSDVKNINCDNNKAQKYLQESINLYQLYKAGKLNEWCKHEG